MTSMTPEQEIAWLAGLVEGEGCVGAYARKAKPQYVYPSLSVKMIDEDVVRRAQRIAGVGRVRGPYLRPPHQPTWQWSVGTTAECRALLERLLPFMGERRSAKIREVLAATDSVDRRFGPLGEAHKAKLSAALTGREVPDDQRAKISAALTGKPKSAAHRAAISRARSGGSS